MDPEHRKILANNRIYFKNNLYVSADMLSYLRDDKIITEEHEEIMMKGRHTRISRINYFVDLIVKRGPKAFECFLKSLILSKQLFVAQHLHQELTEKILIDLQTPTENMCQEEDFDFSDPVLIENLKIRFKNLDIKDPDVVESLKRLLKGYPEEYGMIILKSVLTRIDFNDSYMLKCFKPLLRGCREDISTSSLLKRTNIQLDPKVLACLGPLVDAALKETPPRAAETSFKDEEFKEPLPGNKFSEGQFGPLILSDPSVKNEDKQLTPTAPSLSCISLLSNEFSKNEDNLLTPTAPSLSCISLLSNECSQNEDIQLTPTAPSLSGISLLSNEFSQCELKSFLEVPSAVPAEDEDEPDLKKRSFKKSCGKTAVPV